MCKMPSYVSHDYFNFHVPGILDKDLFTLYHKGFKVESIGAMFNLSNTRLTAQT